MTNPEAVTPCIKSNRQFTRIETGRTLGAKLGVTGTPTFVVNGWRVAPSEKFDAQIDLVMNGKVPYEDFKRRTC